MTVDPRYDPSKAHDYYERHKHLKGRHPGAAEVVKKVGNTTVRPTNKTNTAAQQRSQTAARARVVRLVTKLHSLQDALQEAETALRNKRQETKKNSDGKTTVKERSASKKYRDTHKSEIASKEKKNSSSSGGSSSGSKGVSGMSESELSDRVSKIKGLISNAKQQIQAANAQATSLSHSEFITHSGPLTVNTD